MFNLLDHALKMEKDHGPHRDPKLLENETSYTKYGPLGLCVVIRERYSDLVTTGQWPALAEKIPNPTSNLGAANVNESQKNANGMKCHIYGSEFHLRANYPKRETGTSNGNGTGTEGGNETKSSLAKWRCMHPLDENSTTIVNGTKYYFCNHCVCKFTKKQGFYNRTHTTNRHKLPCKSTTKSDSGTVVTEDTSYSEGSSISSLGIGSAAPGYSLGAISQPPPQPPSRPPPALA